MTNERLSLTVIPTPRAEDAIARFRARADSPITTVRVSIAGVPVETTEVAVRGPGSPSRFIHGIGRFGNRFVVKLWTDAPTADAAAAALRTAQISANGVVTLSRGVPKGWVGDGEVDLERTVRYPSALTGMGEPGPAIVIVTSDRRPAPVDSQRAIAGTIGGRRVWRDLADGRTCTAIVEHPKLWAHVEGCLPAADMERVIASLRPATAVDRRRLTKRSIHAVADRGIPGTITAQGVLPDGTKWREVLMETDFPYHTEPYVSLPSTSVVGLIGVPGAVIETWFPGGNSVGAVDPQGNGTRIAVRTDEDPQYVDVIARGKRTRAYFIPTTNFAYRYAFIRNVELERRDQITIALGKRTEPLTGNDLRWSSPDDQI